LALHFGLGGSVCGGLASCPDGWWKRDADGAQGETGGGTGSGASDEAFAVVLDPGFGQRVEIGDDLGPGACAIRSSSAFLSTRARKLQNT
jgi:hypothetical protein